MKFNFKIQQYQTDAVDAVVNVFAGQPYSSGVSYIRDTGTLNQKPQQLSFLALADNPEKMELEDLLRDSGYKTRLWRFPMINFCKTSTHCKARTTSSSLRSW